MVMPSITTMAQAEVFEENVSEKLVAVAEPEGAFDIPPEIKATMSEEELLSVLAVPGYFTPKQVSVKYPVNKCC